LNNIDESGSDSHASTSLLLWTCSSKREIEQGMERMNTNEWLICHDINIIMRCLTELNRGSNQPEDIVFFGNYFSTYISNSEDMKLRDDNFNKCVKSIPKADSKCKDKTRIVPVSDGNVHWFLFVVDWENKKIISYDSLNGDNEKKADLLLKFIY
jgi:Ulp1 family protease